MSDCTLINIVNQGYDPSKERSADDNKLDRTRAIELLVKKVRNW